jgi:hypothetical protein
MLSLSRKRLPSLCTCSAKGRNAAGRPAVNPSLMSPSGNTSKKPKTMNRKQCLALVERINDLNAIRAMVADVAKGNQKRGTWSYFAQKLLKWVDGGMTGKPPFSVIIVANGNKKLPFFAFSSLAIADCPGKGTCQGYCYSLKAWRYPAAFFRQLQNSLLMRHNPQAIAAAWNQIPTRQNGSSICGR